MQAYRVRNHADARRIQTLLTAAEASLDDLAVRFGPTFGDANGLGAKQFARSVGLLTMSSPNLVTHEVAVARTLRDRLPACWSLFLAGELSWSRARIVVAQADGLDDERWSSFDAAAARLATSSHRLTDDLRKARERLQDDTAAKRARTTFEQRRTSLELGHDGGVAFVLEGLATTWMPINDALHRAAVAAHGTDPLGRSVAQLRHDIAADVLAAGLRTSPTGEGVSVPVRKPVEVQLTLTVPALAWLGHSTEQATLAGYGPIAMERAEALAGTATSFIRVLTHPYTGVRLAMDRRMYRPPADLARWVRIRDGRSRFPGSNTPAHLCDIDHAREWQDGGRTDADNLVTLSRPIHLAKSAGLIEEEYLDTGVVGWDDTWGNHFEDPPPDPVDPAPPEVLPPAPPDEDDVPPF